MAESDEARNTAILTTYGVAAFLVTCVLIASWQRWRKRLSSPSLPHYTKGHRWTVVDGYSHPAFCCVCGSHISHGAFCDCCGVCADHDCLTKANKRIQCKEVTSKKSKAEHQWVKGNLPLCSVCDDCQEPCGTEPKLSDLRCCWCQRTVHETCMQTQMSECDLGVCKDYIVPARCLKVKKVGWKGQKHFVLSEIIQVDTRNWCPIVVFGTKKSGNADGATVLSAFRAVLNPAQVIDVDVEKPERGLEWCRLMPNRKCRILVCAGDGTIGWILSAISKLNLSLPPHVAILPLGTGNDLSRVLGWGEGHSGNVDVVSYLHAVAVSEPVKLDRWLVQVTYARHLGFRWPSRQCMMNNYASIGVDALVTLNFHRQRQNQPHIFRSRLLNKLVYFFYGTKDCLERECLNLHENLQVELDGRRVELPELEGIVVMSISSWGSGCRLWNIGKNSKTAIQKQDDCLLEVVGLYSSFHIAQLQVGLSEPYRIGQASRVTLILSGSAPMQVDGEPWEQGPATITLTHHSQANMLQRI